MKKHLLFTLLTLLSFTGFGQINSTSKPVGVIYTNPANRYIQIKTAQGNDTLFSVSGFGLSKLPTPTITVQTSTPTSYTIQLPFVGADQYTLLESDRDDFTTAQTVYQGNSSGIVINSRKPATTYYLWAIAKGFGRTNSNYSHASVSTGIITPTVSFTDVVRNEFTVVFGSPDLPFNTIYDVSVDGGTATPQSSPYTVSGLIAGSTHTIVVTPVVTDMTGITSATQSITTIPLTTPVYLWLTFGDSIDYGMGTGGTTSSASYYAGAYTIGDSTTTKSLQRRLNQNTSGAVYVTYAEGFPGQTSGYLLNNSGGDGHFDALLNYVQLNAGKYDKVFFQAEYGTNDESSAGETVEQLIQNINDINTAVKAVAGNVIAVAYPVASRSDSYALPTTNAFRNSYNAQIKANPAIINADIVPDFASFDYIYADNATLNPVFFNAKDLDGLSGVHPTNQGALALAEMNAQAIVSYTHSVLPPQTSISSIRLPNIVLNAIPVHYNGDADFTVSYTTNDTESPVMLSSSNHSVATIVNGLVHIVGNGQTYITASQPTTSSFYTCQVRQPLVIGVQHEYVFTGTLTENPAGTFTGPGYSKATETIAANADVQIRTTYNSATLNNAAVLGLDTSSVTDDYSAPWLYQIYPYGSSYYTSYHNYAGTPINVIPVAGDIFQLRRVGATGAVVLEVSKNGGETFTKLYTFSVKYKGPLYIKIANPGNQLNNVSSGVYQNP